MNDYHEDSTEDSDVVLKPFEFRLLNEYNELKDKNTALRKVIYSTKPSFVSYSPEQINLMSIQLNIMNSYLDVLEARMFNLGIDYDKINKYL